MTSREDLELELITVLRGYEAWEAALILEARENLLDYVSNDLYEWLLTLQAQRNNVLAKVRNRV